MAELPATRETPARGRKGDRPGRVTGVEQHQLRGSLGWLIYGERAARGWSQEVLAVGRRKCSRLVAGSARRAGRGLGSLPSETSSQGGSAPATG